MQSLNLETLHLDANSTSDHQLASQLLREGHLVGIPTETVYGLAADATNEKAIAQIFMVKKRPINHPLIVHVATTEQMKYWVKSIPLWLMPIIKQFSPGPITYILPKAPYVSNLITGGLDTVAVRIPDLLSTRALIQLVGKGIVAPSANVHQHISPTQPEHVFKLDGKIAAVLDAGPCEKGLESTIIDCTHYPPVARRPGPVSASEIQKYSDIRVAPSNNIQRVPGNMKVHYAPSVPADLLSDLEIQNLHDPSSIGIIFYSDLLVDRFAKKIRLSSDPNEYAREIYAALHELDNVNISRMVIECPPTGEAWISVHDRLVKACAKGA